MPLLGGLVADHLDKRIRTNHPAIRCARHGSTGTLHWVTGESNTTSAGEQRLSRLVSNDVIVAIWSVSVAAVCGATADTTSFLGRLGFIVLGALGGAAAGGRGAMGFGDGRWGRRVLLAATLVIAVSSIGVLGRAVLDR